MTRIAPLLAGPLLALSLVTAGNAAEPASPLGGLPSFNPATSAAAPTMLPSEMTARDHGAAAPDGDLAFGAFQRGYFATALNEAMIRLKHNLKDGAAMALVGEIYAQGLAVRPNPTEAAKWDRLASEQGNREGTFSYGMALLQGNGVPKDRKAAAALLQKAAAEGHAGALYNLGIMAIQGDDQTHDYAKAAIDFQRAADAGDLDARFALATLYETGRGVPLDLPKAAAMMKQAADAKHIGAQVEYAIMLFNGKGVEKNEAEAARYFQRAAYQGNPIAENRLARILASGRGLPKDPVEAAHWHIMARAAGIADPWLDGQLAALRPADKAKVEEIIRRQLGD